MKQTIIYKPRKFDSATLLLLITGVFAVYGPTFDAICSTGFAAYIWWGVAATAALILIPSWFKLDKVVCSKVDHYIQREEDTQAVGPWRRSIFKFLSRASIVLITVGPLLLIIYGVLEALNIGPWNPQFVISSADFCGNSSVHWTAFAQLALALGVIAVVLLWARKKRSDPMFIGFPLSLFTGILLISLLITYFTPAGFDTREGDYLPYVNVYVIALILVSLLLFTTKKGLHCLFSSFNKKHKTTFSTQLHQVELFHAAPVSPKFNLPRVFHGLLISPFLYLPQVLLLPALVALLVPTGVLHFWVNFALFISWLLVAWGGMYQRWNEMIFMISRLFFRGLPLLVSIVVIGLSVARYCGIHYVATVLDVARFGAVTMLVIMFYSLSWLYDHFLNRPLSQLLLELLGAEKGEETLVYNYSGNNEDDRRQLLGADKGEETPVYNYSGNNEDDRRHIDNRFLHRHGASRFTVLGMLQKGSGNPEQAYHIWGTLELFKKITEDDGSSPLNQKNKEVVEAFRGLRRRIRLYRGVMNGLSIIILGGTLWLLNIANGSYTDLHAFITVEEVNSHPAGSESNITKGTVYLKDRLMQQRSAEKPAILLVASGGGTRAALYTYSVLRGLAEQGELDNVVLASGVSGGGVALAYFASHYNALKEAKVSDKVWTEFRERMAAPFVKDVLEGVLEPRLYWKTRLGVLLEESFTRHFGDKPQNNTLYDTGYNTGIGLIFNTSITAHPCHSSDLTTQLFECEENVDNGIAYTTLRGGRLILTNLKEKSAFHNIPPRLDTKQLQQSSIAPDIYLPYKIIQSDKVTLTEAGALNANFPPVFFDAPIEIDVAGKPQRFYVTDGGATDNRGLVSLLYALRHALKNINDMPAIHIIVAEASATGHDYTSPIGLGTAFSSAKEVLANGLINELMNDVKTKAPKSEVYYLNMPTVLRSRGGLGTHWLMPGTVTLSDPFDTSPSSSDSKSISSQQYKCLMDILYGSYNALDIECSGALKKLGGKATQIKISNWICKEDSDGICSSPNRHIEYWHQFKKQIKRTQ